ncbi:MAG: alpha/beta hydrolase [Proteobacteria bacterium]|nr:alpha/beta hydrolase [Pseudomonadota bacterium]
MSESPTSHSYFSERLRLHYLDWGNTDQPAMLLLHGVQDHCHTWDWFAPRFADRYHLVAPDLRGHGDSEWCKGAGYHTLDYVYDTAQLVNQAKLQPLTLVAHSMGGTIAALFAGVFPERVERLVLLEGVGLHPGWADGLGAAQRIRNWIEGTHTLAGRLPRRYDNLQNAFERMQKANPHLSPEQARHLTAHGSNQNEDGTYSWKFDNYTHAHPPYGMPEDQITACWERVACPVLIINARDGYGHRIGQNGTDAYFKDVRMVNVDAAGHWVHHDQLEKVVDEVDAFLKS